jgi:hypothetical protein
MSWVAEKNASKKDIATNTSISVCGFILPKIIMKRIKNICDTNIHDFLCPKYLSSIGILQ